MYTYAISFRLAQKTINGKTYDERRESIEKAANAGTGFWNETTSFILTVSTLSTPDLAKKLSAELSRTDDMLAVFDPGDMSCAYFGAFKHSDVLAAFFRTAHKV